MVLLFAQVGAPHAVQAPHAIFREGNIDAILAVFAEVRAAGLMAIDALIALLAVLHNKSVEGVFTIFYRACVGAVLIEIRLAYEITILKMPHIVGVVTIYDSGIIHHKSKPRHLIRQIAPLLKEGP